MASSPSQAPAKILTREELRVRRCIAFGIENAVPIDAKSFSVSSAFETSQKSKVKSEPEIIDLLWDDSSEEYDNVAPAKKKRAVKMNAPFSMEVAKNKSPPGSSKSDSKTQTLSEDTQSPSGSRSFQVATWNVWFGPMGDGSPHAALRMRTIVRLLRESNVSPLWCIGFQEVVDATALTLQPALQAANYQWFRQPSSAAYGCAMAIHKDATVLQHGWVPYSETVMQRGFLYALMHLPIPEKISSSQKPMSLLFITTHLESYTGPQYTGAKQRPGQLFEIHSFVQEQLQSGNAAMAIVSGDLNWDDERIRSVGVDPPLLSTLPSSAQWKDTWIESLAPDLKQKLGQSASGEEIGLSDTPKKRNTKVSSGVVIGGYTYDGKLNPMLSGPLRRRFDRILVLDSLSSSGGSVQIVSTQLLGTEAIQDWTWMKYNSFTQTRRETPTAPSDHFGYSVTFQV